MKIYGIFEVRRFKPLRTFFMHTIQWLPVVGFEDSYEVSNNGQVRSKDRWVLYKHGGKRFWPSVTISQWVPKNGYPSVTLKQNDVGYNKMIHRLVAEAFIPNPDRMPQVNHKDNIKTNNLVDNLEWCDQSQNIRHAYDNGFHKSKGGTHYNAKPVIDHATNKYYPTLKEAAEAAGYTPTELCRMLKGQTTNRTKMRYIYPA